MKNKRILFTAPRTAEYLDCDIPQFGDNSVLVKLLTSSISSGTERANVIGDPNISTETNDGTVKFPRQGGYSSTGIIVDIGSNVKDLQAGDRVAISWSVHQRYVAVARSNVYKLPDSIGNDAGALIHIATFPLAAIRKTQLEIGESALVMGCGVLGLIAVQMLRIGGAVPVIAVDPTPERRAQALRFGADYALDPFEEGFAERVKQLTCGGANAVIEVTGNGKALDMALDCTARFGRVALLGCTRHSDFSIDYYRKIHAPGITLIGAHTRARPGVESSNGWWTQRDDAEAIIKLISMGRLDLASMVEDVRLPCDAPEVYTRLCNEKSFPITQFDWTKEEN